MFGVGIAATGAVVAGLDAFATVAGFGAGAGLVVGAVTGQYADAADTHPDRRSRVLAVAVGLGLLGGAGVGGVTAWAYDRALSTFIVGGAAAGVVFGAMLGVALLAGTDPE